MPEQHADKERLISQLFSIPPQVAIKFTRITSGITNILYKCEWDPNGCCLLRFYGKNTEAFINRSDEIAVMEYLHTHFGWFPPIYGSFACGIVYGFLAGTSLTSEQLRDEVMAKRIAQFLACWHKNITIDGLQSTTPNSPSLLDSLKYLYTNIPKRYTDPAKEELAQSLIKPILPPSHCFNRALERLHAATCKLQIPIVFCHNDLLAGNIVWNEQVGIVRFIDFEYATYNYRGYDIANHFCEFAGFECNWDAIPDRNFRAKWIEWYLQMCDEKSDANSVHALLEEVDLFIPFSHLYWSLWALHQAESSLVDFDYLSYAARRLNQCQSLFLNH